MNKCSDCKHYLRTGTAYSEGYFIPKHFWCTASKKRTDLPEVDSVTGKKILEASYLEKIYHNCKDRNSDGNCSSFEAVGFVKRNADALVPGFVLGGLYCLGGLIVILFLADFRAGAILLGAGIVGGMIYGLGCKMINSAGQK